MNFKTGDKVTIIKMVNFFGGSIPEADCDFEWEVVNVNGDKIKIRNPFGKSLFINAANIAPLVEEQFEVAPEVAGEREIIIKYDEDVPSTTITIDDMLFDTSPIEKMEIEDWAYPFRLARITWRGIFAEIADSIGTEQYTIKFSGSDRALNELMSECPDTVDIVRINGINAAEWEGRAVDMDNAVIMAIADMNPLSDEQYEFIRKHAEGGNSEAQRLLGLLYRDGAYVEEDIDKAVEWLQKSADGGCSMAMYNLGHMYYFGYDVDEDNEKAFRLFRKAVATDNHTDSLYYVGECYYYGYGTNQDYARAFKYYEEASEGGSAEAKNMLGMMYSNGIYVKKDEFKAFGFFKEAAESSLAVAQYNLGDAYEEGRGTNKNISLAYEWYKKAAEQGNAPAQNSVGMMYYNGTHVKKNQKKAKEWFLRAAENGNAVAQYNLGYMYHNGIANGGVADDNEARKWLEMSAEQEYEPAVELLEEINGGGSYDYDDYDDDDDDFNAYNPFEGHAGKSFLYEIFVDLSVSTLENIIATVNQCMNATNSTDLDVFNSVMDEWMKAFNYGETFEVDLTNDEAARQAGAELLVNLLYNSVNGNIAVESMKWLSGQLSRLAECSDNDSIKRYLKNNKSNYVNLFSSLSGSNIYDKKFKIMNVFNAPSGKTDYTPFWSALLLDFNTEINSLNSELEALNSKDKKGTAATIAGGMAAGGLLSLIPVVGIPLGIAAGAGIGAASANKFNKERDEIVSSHMKKFKKIVIYGTVVSIIDNVAYLYKK